MQIAFCKVYTYVLKQVKSFIDFFQINLVLALGENEWWFDYLPMITEAYPVYSSADKMFQVCVCVCFALIQERKNTS